MTKNAPKVSTRKSLSHSSFVRAVYIVATSLAIFLGGQIIGVALISIFGSALFGASGDAITTALDENVSVRFLLTLLVEAITVWLVYRALKARNISLAAIGLTKKPKLKHCIEALRAYIIYFVVFLVVFTFVEWLGIIDTSQAQQLGFSNPNGFDLVLTFVSLVILPPIAEEVLFRGYLYQGLKKHAPKVAAILTSILFAAAHLEFGTGLPLNWAAAMDTFVLSVVLIYATNRSKSLWPAIFLHALKNCFAFVTLFIIK